MTLQIVAEDKRRDLTGQEKSPEARTSGEKKRERARAEEQDNERELIKSSMSGMESQRQDMNKFMENFTAAQQQQQQHEFYVNAAVFLEKQHSGFVCIHLPISDTG